jgi:hypothetical protein
MIGSITGSKTLRLKRTSLIAALCMIPIMASAQNVIFSNNLPQQQQGQGLSSSTPLPPSLMEQVTRQQRDEQNQVQQGQAQPQHVQYQEGFDVYGRPVAPANVSGQPTINMPQQYPVLITVNQAQMMGVQLPYMPVQADSFVGTAIVGLDGSVSFNGQDVSADKLYPMCGLVGR